MTGTPRGGERLRPCGKRSSRQVPSVRRNEEGLLGGEPRSPRRWMSLDQRIELSPPRAPPQSTMTIVGCWHLNRLMRLMDGSPRDKNTLAPTRAIRQGSCSHHDKTVHSATMSNGQISA